MRVLGLLLIVAFLVLVERNVLRLVQVRKRPNTVGVYRIAQTVMDRIKLLLKEIVYVGSAQFIFFSISPVVCFILSILSWLFVPVPFILYFSKYSILITLFLSSLLVYPVLWARWRSRSIFSLLRRVRAVAQIISYEVVMGLFLIIFLVLFRHPCWEGFLYYEFTGTISCIILFLFFIWIRVITAELNRSPFDLVERESELVSGYNVEYSGYRFTLLFLAEYMNIWLIGFITAVIFVRRNIFLQFIIASIVVLLGLYIRSIVPRFKFTDLIMLTWKVYLPITLVILSLILILVL